MYYQLNKEQKNFWLQHGFVILHDFFPAKIKHNFLKWCDELTILPETPGKWMKYYEKNIQGERQLCRMENFLDYHESMNEVAAGKRTLHLLSDLMGESAVIFKEKINYKFPSGSGFKPHQDAPAFVSFKQKFHITMMIAIDDCTVENGCLQIVKDQAKNRKIFPQQDNGAICEEIVKQFIWHPLECKSGEVILFHSYVPHYSEPNKSKNARRVFYITYNKASEGSKRNEYYLDKREKFPPDCERDPNKDYSSGAAIYNVANPITEK